MIGTSYSNIRILCESASSSSASPIDRGWLLASRGRKNKGAPNKKGGSWRSIPCLPLRHAFAEFNEGCGAKWTHNKRPFHEAGYRSEPSCRFLSPEKSDSVRKFVIDFCFITTSYRGITASKQECCCLAKDRYAWAKLGIAIPSVVVGRSRQKLVLSRFCCFAIRDRGDPSFAEQMRHQVVRGRMC